jgi:hypothetical protein
MPVVHVKEVEDVPALAIQFANDCEELAIQATELKAQYAAWNTKSAEDRLLTLSQTVQEKQIVSFPWVIVDASLTYTSLQGCAKGDPH